LGWGRGAWVGVGRGIGRARQIGMLNREAVNIIYCYSEDCHLAANACLEFSEKGVPVMDLEGGFESWKEHNLPIEMTSRPWVGTIGGSRQRRQKRGEKRTCAYMNAGPLR